MATKIQNGGQKTILFFPRFFHIRVDRTSTYQPIFQLFGCKMLGTGLKKHYQPFKFRPRNPRWRQHSKQDAFLNFCCQTPTCFLTSFWILTPWIAGSKWLEILFRPGTTFCIKKMWKTFLIGGVLFQSMFKKSTNFTQIRKEYQKAMAEKQPQIDYPCYLSIHVGARQSPMVFKRQNGTTLPNEI
jgi:hypothetical protein